MYECKVCKTINRKAPIKCPECGTFDSYEEIKDVEPANKKAEKKTRKKVETLKLKDVVLNNDDRVLCGISEVDRVMGGGFVSDSVNILTAPPGQGKSTLLLAVANALAERGKTVLYVSSEESAKQIKGRAKRILESGISDNLYICDTKETNDIEYQTEKLNPDVLIVDSVSSFCSADLNSQSGTPTQIRYCSDMIIRLCKSSDKPRIAIIIAHVTKDDELAGSRALEHDVDAVMYLEGEKDDELRVLRTVKNRFGELDTGLFLMTDTGLKELDNPSEYFTTKRDAEEKVSGVALTMIKEGSRMIVVEIEALLSKTFSAYPTRIATCLRRDNFNILLSIIEQSLKIKLYDKNAIISTTGRIKLSNPSSDLAIIMSVLSAYYSAPIDNTVAFIGEVGLTGELKRTTNIEKCLKELDRLNYKTVYVPRGEYRVKDLQNLTIIKCKDIADVTKKCNLIKN